MTIKLITLKTNHTLMSDYTVEGDIAVLKQPVQVVSVPPRSQNEQPSLAFVPFLEFSQEFKTGIKVSADDVLCVTTPIVELENQYNQIFGSGIEIASSIPKL